MSAKEVFRVLYAPQKAFKEVINNPKYIGPLLIMVLFVVANVGFGYILLSKTYLDQTLPHASDLDKWTEDVAYWNSNASITANTADYISGTYYGNKSISFNLTGSQVYMQLNFSTPVSCSGSTGYKNFSFRVKQTEPTTNPSNVSIYLLSTTPQDTFYQNVTGQLTQNGVWNNLTVTVGPESSGWISNGSASWENITSFILDFTWSSDSNTTLLIDGLFFHGVYKSGMETASGFLLSYPINKFMEFTIQWVTFGGLLYVIPKIFKVKTIWKPLLTIAGFALVTIFIQAIANSVVLLASPEFRYPLVALGGVSGESQAAYTKVFGFSDQVLRGIEIAIYFWAIALAAIGLRLLFAFSWMKSLFISALAYLASLLVFRFLTYGAIWI